MTVATLKLFQTTVGKKAIMAVTGLMMAGFVTIHMVGNLQIFAGPDKINHYATFLKSVPALLWGTRIVIGLAALIHTFTAILLIVHSIRARNGRYAKRSYSAATLSSRTMIFTGPIILGYAIYHLLHQTLGTIHPDFSPVDVHRNVVVGFSDHFTAGLYIAAMIVLALHLIHGLWSMFQTMGLNSVRTDHGIRRLALLVALAVALGFIAVPAAVVISGFVVVR